MRRRTGLLLLFVLLAAVLAGGYWGRDEWCVRQLPTPVFEDGDLRGRPDRIIDKLGSPAATLSLAASSLSGDKSMRDLFRLDTIVALADRQVKVLLWEKTCLGSTIWRFAVVTDAESGQILTVGGESSYYAPIYLGGGAVGSDR
jgi:hypothetical protein